MLRHDRSDINKQLTFAQGFLARYNRETGQKALEYKEKNDIYSSTEPFFRNKAWIFSKVSQTC